MLIFQTINSKLIFMFYTNNINLRSKVTFQQAIQGTTFLKTKERYEETRNKRH